MISVTSLVYQFDATARSPWRGVNAVLAAFFLAYCAGYCVA
jgi:hypothetical protein